MSGCVDGPTLVEQILSWFAPGPRQEAGLISDSEDGHPAHVDEQDDKYELNKAAQGEAGCSDGHADARRRRWEGCVSALSPLEHLFERWLKETHANLAVSDFTFLRRSTGQVLYGSETCHDLGMHSGEQIIAKRLGW
ncbi:hypothetical protein IAU60_003424 [Kwoniella sp. DSM 27419]